MHPPKYLTVMLYRTQWYFLGLLFLLCLGACQPDSTDGTRNAPVPPTNVNLPSVEEDFPEERFKWGFIEPSGRLVIPDFYDEVRAFQEGLAVVRQKGRWGYIDKRGRTVIPVQYRGAWSFSNGMARVLTFDEKMGFINPKGEWIIAPNWEEVTDFEENRARIRLKDRFGYINTSGEIVVDPIYTEATAFKDGLACVQYTGRYGLIDTSGQFLFQVDFDRMYHPSDGLVRVKKEGKFGFVDLQGKLRLSPKYLAATDFNHGLAAVVEEDAYGLINQAGEWVLPAEYDQLFYGGEGRWIAAKEGKFGAVGRTGEIVIPCQYDEMYGFSSGLSFYYSAEADMWGIIDSTGRKITQARYPLVWPFEEDMARAVVQGGIGYINKMGKVVIPPAHLEVREFSEQRAAVQVYRR